MSTLDSGRTGEDEAARFLINHGYRILKRNFRSKFGEVDIVAQEANTLVFVEVKTRWNKKYGNPEEAVTPRKLSSIVRAGQYYKLLNPKTPDLLRVDVVAIDMTDGGGPQIRLLKNVTF